VGIAVKMTRSIPRRASPMFLFQGWRLELQRAKMMKGEVKKNCMSLAMYHPWPIHPIASSLTQWRLLT
jgi:hypothetical protein